MGRPLCASSLSSRERRWKEKLGMVLKQMIIKPCFKFPVMLQTAGRMSRNEPLSKRNRPHVSRLSLHLVELEKEEQTGIPGEQEEQWREMLWKSAKQETEKETKTQMLAIESRG